MILELFWPKEIKQAIAECRSRGNLNEEAVEHLHSTTNKHFAIGVILSLASFFVMGPKVGVIFFGLLPIAIWFDFKNMFIRELAPYVDGKRVEAIVTFSGISLYGAQYIWCELTDVPKKYKITICNRPKIDPKHFPKKGDKLFIYHSDMSKHMAMPDIQELNKKYSLMKLDSVDIHN